MEIKDIKQRLRIIHVLSHYNITPDKNHHIRCPFHEDDQPSCKIYLGTNTFHCFGCGATGDQIELIQKMEKCDKHTALKKATELVGDTKNTDVMGITSKGAAKETSKLPNRQPDFAELFAKQKEGLPRSPKAQEYLKSRWLENLSEVGYNSGTSWKKLKQCITFPLKDKNGNIVSLYGRRIIDSTPRYRTIVSCGNETKKIVKFALCPRSPEIA